MPRLHAETGAGMVEGTVIHVPAEESGHSACGSATRLAIEYFLLVLSKTFRPKVREVLLNSMLEHVGNEQNSRPQARRSSPSPFSGWSALLDSP